MKHLVLALLFFGFSSFLSHAQSPQAFSYQAVARDASGAILADQPVSFRISILEGSAAGTALYTETHVSTTSSFGLVNLEIGNGTVVTGVFEDISWGSNLYFLQIEMDEAGGTNYIVMGTSQLLSVPYALHSETTNDNTRWIKSGTNDLYYLNGKVGIGTETPVYNMEIHSTTAGMARLRLSTQDYSKSIFFGSGNSTLSPAIYIEGADALRFARYESGVGYTELMRIQADGDVGLGTQTPDEAAILELNSNSRGFLPPRMTTSERLAIPNPPEGLMIYNTDKKTIEFFDGKYWRMPSSPPGASPAFVCGDNFLDTRNQKMYNTVMIGDQCWMAENLNYGTMISGVTEQTDNAIYEKYCYNDLESNCIEYGGLYQWDEMMEYSVVEGAQGICPDGWHIPSDGEWCTLTVYIDPTVDCNTGSGWIGTDCGLKMKSTTGWESDGNGTNTSGFNGLPAGIRIFGDGSFTSITSSTYYKSSTETGLNYSQTRGLRNIYDWVQKGNFNKDDGQSVRCIKD